MNEELPQGWVQTALGAVVEAPRSKASPADHPDLPFVGMDHIAANGMQLLGAGRFGDMKSAGGPLLARRRALRPHATVSEQGPPRCQSARRLLC